MTSDGTFELYDPLNGTLEECIFEADAGATHDIINILLHICDNSLCTIVV